MNTSFIYYFLIINLISYLVYFYDKKQALNDNYRVSEKFLLSLVIIGGTFGALGSMLIYKHKIRKLTFLLKYVVANILFSYLFYTSIEKYLWKNNYYC